MIPILYLETGTQTLKYLWELTLTKAGGTDGVEDGGVDDSTCSEFQKSEEAQSQAQFKLSICIFMLIDAR